MNLSPRDFIWQVERTRAGRIFVTNDPESVVLQTGTEDTPEESATYTAEGPECIGEKRWAEFKRELGEVLSEPNVYSRIAVFDGDHVIRSTSESDPVLPPEM